MKKYFALMLCVFLFGGASQSGAEMRQSIWSYEVGEVTDPLIYDNNAPDIFTEGELFTITTTYDDALNSVMYHLDGVNEIAEFGSGDDTDYYQASVDPTDGNYFAPVAFTLSDNFYTLFNTYGDDNRYDNTDTNYVYQRKYGDTTEFSLEADGFRFQIVDNLAYNNIFNIVYIPTKDSGETIFTAGDVSLSTSLYTPPDPTPDPTPTTHTFNTLANFSVSNTSTVAPGDSQEITLIDEFWGLDWDEQWARGNYALADGDPDTNAYNDYRFSIDTHGRVGLSTEASFNYGTMDVNAPLDINMHTSQEGNTTTVNTDYSILSGAGFSTSGATGNIAVNFKTDAYFRYVAKVAVLGVYTTWEGTYDPLNVYPLIDQDQDDPPFSDSFLGGLINVTAQIPNVTAAGTVTQASGLSGAVSSSSRTASSSGTDSILDVSADIGKAISAVTGIPMSVGLDLYNNSTNIGFDFDATLFGGSLGAEASLSQNFEVTMNPGIHLEFDRPVLFLDEMGWTPVTQITATLGNSINLISSDIVHATTAYTMNWQIANNTDIDIDTYLDLVAGDFEATIGWGVGDITFDPNPLYSNHFETPLAAISVYDERWRISGQDIAGDSFYINLDSDIVDMLNLVVDESTNQISLPAGSLADREALADIVNSLPTSGSSSDLFTENADLLAFLSSYYNTDEDLMSVDFLDTTARDTLYSLLVTYDPDNVSFFEFLLDPGIEGLGIDFQPMLTGEIIDGLMGNFYLLDPPVFASTFSMEPMTLSAFSLQSETLPMDYLTNVDLNDLINTSFAFFYYDLVGMTDLTIYQSSLENPSSFAYAYSSLEQYIANPDPDPVPEPATLLLLGGGLAGLAFYRRKRK